MMPLRHQPLWRRCLVRWFGYVIRKTTTETQYEFRRNAYVDIRL